MRMGTVVHVPRGISWPYSIDIMNEPRLRVDDTVAIGLLKINPDFFSIKTPQKPR